MTRQPSLTCLILSCVLVGGPTSVAVAEKPDADAGAIDQRLKELGDDKSNIPGTEFGLYSELGRLDKEIESYQSSLVAASVIDANLRMLDDTVKEADALFGALASANCATISDADVKDLREKLQKLARTLNRIRFDLEIDDLINPLQVIPKYDVTKDKTTLCGELVQIGKTKRSDVKDYIDSARKQLEHQKNDPAREKTNKLIDALKTRRDMLQKQIGSQVPQKAISANLAWIIAAIGLFSILTLGGVLAFQHDIQVEWVASGQVIQFVTVMIILSVILALGLSEILKENTIGTLLGGLAGYILSQGIGRAAAREVARAQNLSGTGIAVTGLTPNVGPPAGGTLVTISGSGFAAGVSVSVGGIRITPTNVTSASMQIITPAHAAGSAEVVVANPNGQNATLPGGFTYQ